MGCDYDEDAGEWTVRNGHADIAVLMAAGAGRAGAVLGDDAHCRVHRRIPRRDPARCSGRPRRSGSERDEARADGAAAGDLQTTTLASVPRETSAAETAEALVHAHGAGLRDARPAGDGDRRET